jgi:IS5 family transposase
MAKFSIKWLSGKRQFQSLTGVTPEVFDEMVRLLRPHWRERIVEPKKKSGRPWGVGDLEEHLLVLLILYRCHVTQDFLACLYGKDKSCISRSLARIARKVLGVKKRIAVTKEEAQALIMDCTEQPVQRPRKKQRCWYSGKKKRHTVKNEIIITEAGRIVAVSDDAPGRVHDIEVRRRGPPLPDNAHAYADGGYQGYQNDYPSLEIPYKKSKNRPLTKDQKDYNHALSRFRVKGEHAIARMKRFRILSDRFRYPRSSHAAKFATIAGIANLAAGF